MTRLHVSLSVAVAGTKGFLSHGVHYKRTAREEVDLPILFMIPALFTRILMVPHFARIALTASVTSSSDPTLHLIGRNVSLIVSGESETSKIATFAPS
jgi:hypothetical protein